MIDNIEMHERAIKALSDYITECGISSEQEGVLAVTMMEAVAGLALAEAIGNQEAGDRIIGIGRQISQQSRVSINLH